MLRSYCSVLLINLIVVTGCKFRASPYEASAPKFELNAVNLSRINKEGPSVDSDFRIALVSDTHNYYDELKELVNAINNEGPYAFVIITGDITNYGLVEEYQRAKDHFDRLRWPYIVVIGNHDLLSNGDEIYSRMFGPTDFTLSYKNALLIFFNNNNWEAPGVVPNRAWVESILGSSTAPIKLLFAHVSPDDPARFNQMEVAEWESLMTSGKVDYFLHGHDHSPMVTNFGVARRITIGAPSKRSYFELQVTPGGISHQQKTF